MDHLSWPFFEDRHRAFAGRVAEFAKSLTVDHHDVDTWRCGRNNDGSSGKRDSDVQQPGIHDGEKLHADSGSQRADQRDEQFLHDRGGCRSKAGVQHAAGEWDGGQCNR